MSEIRMYDKIRTLIDGIPCFTERDQVINAFDNAGIVDLPLRVEILRKAMSVEASYQAPDTEEISPEDEFNYELDIFLEGSWRLFA